MAEMLIAIITSPPESANLHNPLCELRHVGREANAVAQFSDKGLVLGSSPSQPSFRRQ
jgi:hypothetical protein